LVYFGLEKPFEDFCDFLFVCGLKLLEELNFSEGLDLKVMGEKKYQQKRAYVFSHKGPYLFSLFPFLSFCLFLVRLIRDENEEHHSWHHYKFELLAN
jgi:hypothetical protein